jgi:4a-hydroxytetrahydrobiopterin dehydratase
MEKLTDIEIQEYFKKLKNGWLLKDQSIHQEFKFSSFISAFSFMTAIALEAEKANHHPNWENVYNRVKVTLNTHDAGGLTTKDFDLAQKIDDIYINYSK